MRAALAALFLTATLCFGSACAAAAPLEAGAREQTVKLRGLDMQVFSFRPADCARPSLLVVLHGLGRNADGYRDDAKGIAEKHCMIVLAPLFDETRFPTWAYQRGGIVHHNRIQDARNWTGNFVLDLVQWARTEEATRLDYYLLGHSAGAQFLSRIAAFIPTEAKRIVITNPSSYVMPSSSVAAPFGFGGVYSGAAATAQLRAYLAQPITIFLGQDDVGGKNLSETPEARAQGATRYARGLNTFRAAEKAATQQGWAFGWRLVVVPGVGHSSKEMFSPANAERAFGF
jgi:pimeloyl-ACP methyl ester carboxylesterase